MSKLTTQDFIDRAGKVHGNKYDYSQVEYVNNKTKVKIICPHHGEIKQAPSNHMRGNGCPKCAGDKLRTIFLKSDEQFIKDACVVHEDTYDYSLVHYQGAFKKVKIVCSQHGVFEQVPSDHLCGKGCSKCGAIASGDATRKTTKKFISDAKQLYDDLFDYSLVKYVNAHAKVKIICSKHGVFEQAPNNHLHGKGCPQCGAVAKLNAQSFIERSRKIRSDIYDYSPTELLKGGFGVTLKKNKVIDRTQ